jgi:mxaD protein
MKYLISMLSLVSTAALAHGPTPQKTDESILVNLAPELVWKKLSEPCAIQHWHPSVTGCESSEQNKRVLTLKTGGKIYEEFDEVLASEMKISYRLGANSDTKALPVSSLNGRISIKPEGVGSRVSWMARYYRVDTTNEPPKGMDDESARNAVNDYVKQGLANLEVNPSKK